MDPKERRKIPRQQMPEQDPRRRRHNFEEVPYGYTEELAVLEAKRCLKCKKPGCRQGCPVNIDIPGFIRLIEEGKFLEAAAKLKEQNTLPAVTGRVCPQEVQCESRCILGKKGEPCAIGRLERFAADYAINSGRMTTPKVAAPTGKRVAVVGSGPAGLTAAGDLVKLGHRVTVFEAFHVAGGVLMYGIPEFRLPKRIVQFEVEYLRRLGAEIITDYVVGKAKTVDEIFAAGFDAVFIGTGAGLPIFMRIPGENLIGCYSANEYLTRSNLMKAFRFPEYATAPIRSRRVITVGGGNVAMDTARTALRLGAESIIVYRRSREEMPARKEEIHHAEQEGVQAIECIRMQLGEPDASGRRKPVAVAGSEFQIECDTVIPALGNRPNPLISMTTPKLITTRRGTLECDPLTFETSQPGVFAGGDIVSGAATVISAMGQGKIAARSIHEWLMTGKVSKPEPEKEEPASEE